MAAISDKINGQQIVSAPEPQRTNVVNLMEALQASLEQARSTSLKDVSTATGPAKKTPNTPRRKSRAKSGAGVTGAD
jgi:DNA end-binding protein Ku